MLYRKVRMSLVLVFALLSACTYAQDIGFISTSVVSTNVDLGDTIFINTKLFNYDNSAFTDTVGFKLMVNGNIVTDPLVFKNPLAGQSLNIGGNDSFAVTFKIVSVTAAFTSGPNGLVIWPIVEDGHDARDSIFVNINLLPTAIAEVEGSVITAYSTPDAFIIKSTAAAGQQASVTVSDLSGASVCSVSGQFPFTIPAANLPKGVYLINIALSTHSQRTFKIVHQ